ncbi:hypothetical protein E2C01_065366 [Portunus trituberculatus]|uniref:Uncharacterized protein n=1 Tax=Portunus trituberculatus TaxID=210409 RepID=A0A5B7HPD6_PORTR|nr:hypothetical protein [Portunus trituberculatus]
MADTCLNILERSLATRHGKCIADTTLRILGSRAAAGQGSQMAVANHTTINSAKSTKGTVHYLTYPRNRGMEATCWAQG